MSWIRNGRILSAALLMAGVAHGHAARPDEVRNITYDRIIQAQAASGTDLWAGTTGGALKLDTLTGEYSKFTRVADGLPRNDIRAVAASGDGSVWAGTDLGLARFLDGRWTVFDHTNSPLAAPSITALAVDGDDRVWIGTRDAGLFSFDGTTWEHFTPANSGLSDVFVTSLQIGLDGALWIGAWGDGVDRLDGTTWTNFRPGNTGTPPGICAGGKSLPPGDLGLISVFVNVLGVDPVTGDVWFRNEDDGICLLNGVTRFDGTEWVTFTRENSGLGTNNILAAGFAADGAVWLGGSGRSSRLDGGRWTVFPFTTLSLQRLGTDLWFGTPFGLGRLTAQGAFEEFVKPGLNDNVVADVAISGPVGWFATRAGLVRLENEEFTEFDRFNSGIPAGQARAVETTSRGDVWVGTTVGGAGAFDGSAWTVFNAFNSGLPVNRIEALEIDGEGNIWAGFGLLSGAARYNGDRWETLPVGQVNDIASVEGGDAWLATSSGAVHVAGSRLRTFTAADGLPSNQLTSVALARNGDVWFGSLSAGVARYDGRGFQSFSTANGLSDDRIRAVAVDRLGIVWVGTLDSGLNLYDGSGWSSFTFQDGLVSNRVRSVTFAPSGATWIGTENGASRIDLTP